MRAWQFYRPIWAKSFTHLSPLLCSKCYKPIVTLTNQCNLCFPFLTKGKTVLISQQTWYCLSYSGISIANIPQCNIAQQFYVNHKAYFILININFLSCAAEFSWEYFNSSGREENICHVWHFWTRKAHCSPCSVNVWIWLSQINQLTIEIGLHAHVISKLKMVETFKFRTFQSSMLAIKHSHVDT